MTLTFIVGVIILVWISVFVIAYIYQLNKAKKRQVQTGEAINHGKIFTESLGIACIAGLICCIAEGKAEAKSGGSGNDVEAQPYISVPQMSMPQPGMDWTPVQSAAVDPVQG